MYMLKDLITFNLLMLVISYALALEQSIYTPIEPGYVDIGEIRVNNPGFWSQQKFNKVTSWTKDGTLLNEIVFGRILSGQNILGQSAAQNRNFDYDPVMSLNLIVEQFTDALSVSNYYNVRLHDRKTMDMNNLPAIKFKVSYDTNAGINYSAWILLIKTDGKLLTIFCSASSVHYFPKLEKTFLKIIESVKVL